MFNQRKSKSARNDEGEKPFWISYSDLMTACMTLFLVVMAVTIVSLSKKYEHKYAREQEREKTISNCAKDLQITAEQRFPGRARIEYTSGDAIRIDLGSIVNFEHSRWSINQEASKFLREYIPTVLKTVKNDQCKSYFRRVIVEGYTSKSGDYMTNLDLSLKRSREVVCELAKTNPDKSGGLSVEDKNQVKTLFLVGGFSFNSQKRIEDESRRVELKLEFWQLNDEKKRDQESRIDFSGKEFGLCPA